MRYVSPVLQNDFGTRIDLTVVSQEVGRESGSRREVRQISRDGNAFEGDTE